MNTRERWAESSRSPRAGGSAAARIGLDTRALMSNHLRQTCECFTKRRAVPRSQGRRYGRAGVSGNEQDPWHPWWVMRHGGHPGRGCNMSKA